MDTKWDRISSSPEATALLKLYHRIDEICDHDGDVQEFLPNLLHQLAQLLDVQTMAVSASDPEHGQRLLSRYDRGQPEIQDEQLLNLARKVMETGQQVTDIPDWPSVSNILAIPIAKSARLLGSLILLNKSSGEFGDYDQIVVTLVEMRLDDVLNDMIRKEEQRRVTLENQVMKDLDRIRDESRDQGESLDQMITTILNSVGSEIGFITLYDSERDRHLPGGKIIRGAKPMSQNDYHLVGNLIRQAKEKGEILVDHQLSDSEIDTIMVVPMFMSGLFLGSVVLINKEDGGFFIDTDKQLVEAVTRIIDSFIFQEEKFKRLMVLVGQEATRDVEEALVGRRHDTTHGQRLEITMFFADIRNYSQKTKEMDPSTAVRMLNDYYNAITPLISSHHGVVDKYVGDEIVALFTTDRTQGNHQLLAVNAAMALHAELDRLNREWELTGRPTIDVGIGIHTGEVILGQIGSFDRKDYTAIGSNMNFAARLQSIASAGQIIISKSTYVGITGKIMARRVGPYRIKGFGEMTAYLVEGRSPDQF